MIRPRKWFGDAWRAALAAALLLPGLGSQAQVNLLNGLVAYWPLDGNFEDAVGIFDGEEQGSTSIEFIQGRPGFNQAIRMNGEDQYILITGGEPDDLAFEGGSMSIAGWFRVDAFDTEWQALVAKGEGTSWRVHRNGSTSGFAHAGGVGEGPAGTPVDDGEWHHFVAITDAEALAFGTRLYIDGQNYSENLAPPALAANGLRMRIGDNPGAVGREWEGAIDDIAIWDRVLTEDEVEYLWNNGAGRSIKSLQGVQIDILGVGAEALLGGDLTDPEDDGSEEAGPDDPSWNWAGISASHEPGFGGGEFAFNIFDNAVGGGNDKWCCDDPTPGNPVWVAVEFPGPVSITHFTVTSGNDSPERDPTDWAIQGSNDGSNYTDIYHFTGNPAPWTERNQVLKFTLPEPSPTYRFIRYIAYETPGDLHQINEIEYFGVRGAANIAFISAIRNSITEFGFRVNDQGTSVVDPATVQLTLDGQAVNLGTLAKTDGMINVTYTPAQVFLPSSTHTYSIRAQDNFGNVLLSEGSFTTRAYAYLTDTDKVTPNTAQRGFIFNVHQNQAFQNNDNIRPVQQLAGLLGPNLADAYAIGPALDVGTPQEPGNLPIRFEIESVINMNQDFGGAAGNIPDDWPIPGVPGIEGSNDGIAAEIITYVDLPAGVTTMIFNSDDGFRTTTGWVRDEFRSQLAGEFVGGRGAADTAFDVYAETAGTYAFRTIWYEGNGGAALEWLTVDSGGNKVLLNGEGGLTTYRAITGVGPTVISSVTPGIGATGVFFDSPISATLTDGDAPVDAASVRISLDGVQTPATATKNNGVTTISFSPPDFLTPGQHTASITFTAGGQSRTETWSFTVGAYAVLTAAQQAVSANTSQPGFIWRVFQNEAVQHTTLAQTELALAGQLTQNGQPLENLANPDAAGANVTGRGVQDGPLIRFEMPGVINVSQWEGDMNGNFTPDEPMPGIPGMTGMNDGIDAEIITYLQLPAGVITMGVNSDDGFRTQAGYINVPADGIILGQFDGGRGATDTIFKFLVRDAGIYPFRTIWQEGGGGANIEWFTVKADGSKVLVNDRANGGIPAYRVGVAPDKPTESFLAIDAANGQIQITWDAAGATLERSINLIDWTAVTGATSPYSVPNPTGQGAEYFRLRQ